MSTMETDNKQPKNLPLKKAAIDLLLNMVKFLIFTKKIFVLFFNLLAKFTVWILRLTLKKPLIRIYYWIFRFKKEGLIENSIFDIVRKKIPHFLVVLLVIISFISNLKQPSKISAVTENMSKTTMAQLVSGEFSNLEQESMIQETLNPASIQDYANDQYSHDQFTLKNELPVTDDNIDYNEDQFAIERNVDYLSKPYLWNNNSNSGFTGTTVAQKRTSTINHTVKEGETISSIARTYGINVNTILWANNLGPRSLIRPGNQLIILSQNGVIYTVAKGDTIGKIARKYGVTESSLLANNNLGNSLKIGEKIIIPGGRMLAENTAPTKSVTKNNSYTGISVIKDLVKAPKTKAAGGNMAWPTVGHRITQYYSWRHTGLDIANKVGTPLYAVESGTVEFSGWSRGYGNNVVINHGGGKKTRYAHASKLFVSVGDSVERGENIAAMGSTGWSTGSHIHFEVIVGGVKYNPLNYIK